MTSSDLDVRLETTANALVKISVLVHWLTLPEEARTTIAAAFPELSDAEIALRLGKDIAIVSKWREQAAQLALVFDLIKAHKAQPYPGTLTSNAVPSTRGAASRSLRPRLRITASTTT